MELMIAAGFLIGIGLGLAAGWLFWRRPALSYSVTPESQQDVDRDSWLTRPPK